MIKTLKTYYRFLFAKRLWAVAFVVLLIATPISEALFPYFFKLFVDAIPSLNYSTLIKILGGYIAVRFGSQVLEAAKFFVGDVLSIAAVKNIRKTVFSHIQDLDFAFHSQKSSGSLISAFKRGDGAIWDLHFAIHQRIVAVTVTFAVMLFFFRGINSEIFILAIVSFAVAIAIGLIFIRANNKTRVKLNFQEDRFTSVIADNMINFETVKLFGKEDWERRRLDRKLGDWFSAVWKFVYTFRYLDAAMAVIMNVSIFLILYISIRLAVSQTIEIGDFVLVASFIGYFYPGLWEMIWGLRDLTTKYIDVQKYFKLLDYDIEVLDPEKPVKVDHVYGEVEFKRLSFAYKNRAKYAVHNINLKIEQGQALALVGRSGSGKTTLVKLLMRFYDPQKGLISLDGINIKDFTKSDLRGFIGVVPQEPILFNNTIAYNIGYGKSGYTMAEIKNAAKIANIDEFIESLPRKYKTEVGERGVRLSGGQKQRLAIARMIVSNPDIVIFDEATSHLDSESEKLIQDAFWKARRGKTTIIIAHRLSTIMRADRIIVMEYGKIKESGTHESLLKQKDSLYSHFWNLQLKLD